MITFPNNLRLAGEFDRKLELEGARLNERLQALLFSLAGFADYHFGKDVIITHILGSQAEQDKIYGSDLQYQKKPWKSVHQFGRGIDVRVWGFSDKEVAGMLDFVNRNFPYGGGKPAALVHNVGRGNHIHVQVPG